MHALASVVRLVYCADCQALWQISRFEREICRSCGKAAQIIRLPYSWQSWAGISVILAGAVFLLTWEEFSILRVAVFLAILIAGFGLAAWGTSAMKAKFLSGRKKPVGGKRS